VPNSKLYFNKYKKALFDGKTPKEIIWEFKKENGRIDSKPIKKSLLLSKRNHK